MLASCIKLIFNIRRIAARFLTSASCPVLGHAWIYELGSLRSCPACKRREILVRCTRWIALSLAALLFVGCGSLPPSGFDHDPIEHFATEGDAAGRAVEYALTTAGGLFFRCRGGSMRPFEYFAVGVQDFARTKVGDRVVFTALVRDRFHPPGQPPIPICHRVVAIEKDGRLRVAGDTYPARTDWVTPENYIGTVVLICAWDR